MSQKPQAVTVIAADAGAEAPDAVMVRIKTRAMYPDYLKQDIRAAMRRWANTPDGEIYMNARYGEARLTWADVSAVSQEILDEHGLKLIEYAKPDVFAPLEANLMIDPVNEHIIPGRSHGKDCKNPKDIRKIIRVASTCLKPGHRLGGVTGVMIVLENLNDLTVPELLNGAHLALTKYILQSAEPEWARKHNYQFRANWADVPFIPAEHKFKHGFDVIHNRKSWLTEDLTANLLD